VPHAIAVEVEELDEGRVHAVLFVEMESQKGILIGKAGSMIKAIGAGARPEIERLLGGKVYLELQVKVRPQWRRDENVLERFGI
jgi:GTP-binding protein Era